jgi:adenylate cyclase, class 2
MTGPLETEVKIPMPDGAAAARLLIEAHGYRITAPRILQVDQVFDFPDRSLRQSGRLLRVRSEGGLDGAAILTFKGPAVSASPHKSREELETSAGSRATLELILERLGFVPSFRYEKYRTIFRTADEYSKVGEAGFIAEAGLIALDETPIGVFLELEGAGYWIDRTALQFGFMPKDYITASYAALYREYLGSHTGPSDMTFLSNGVGVSGKDS